MATEDVAPRSGPPPTAAEHYTRRDYVDDLVAPLAVDAEVVHLTGAETINGAKTFGTAPQVPVGSLLANPVRRDDARLTDARTPTAHATSHGAGQADPLAPSDIGAVPTSRTVTAGTGLSGGGDLTANRALAVSYGSTAGSAVQGNDARVTADQAAGTASIRTLGAGALQAAAGNDARLSDARTPTAHGHAGEDITSGTLDAARLPRTMGVLGSATSAGGAVNVDAALVVGPRILNTTCTGTEVTVGVPTNGADRQVLRYAFLASGGTRSVAIATGIRTSAGITRGPHTVPSGEVLLCAMEYVDFAAAWVLTALTISET